MSYSVIIRGRTPKLKYINRQIRSFKIVINAMVEKDRTESGWSVCVEEVLHLSDWGEPLLRGDIELRPEWQGEVRC